MRRLIKEAKADLELAITKCLTGAKLTSNEVNEVCALGESDLMRDYGCDLYMAETVKLHSKKELMRLRAQNQFTKIDGLWNDTGYPTKPYTRTDYIKESRRRLREDHHEEDHHDDHDGGRMLDYGHTKSDSEEGRMMKQTLRDIAVDAYRLHQLLDDGDDLPQWCQYKTAQAQQMIGSVRHYLEYKLERMGDDLVGEEEMFDPEEMKDDFGEDSAEMAMDSWSDGDDDDFGPHEDSDDYDDDDDLDDMDDMDDMDDHEDTDDDDGYDGADKPISLEKDDDYED